MSATPPRALGEQFRRDVEQYINANLDNPDAAWPVSRPDPAPHPAGDGTPEANDLSVFAGGNLYLEYEVHIELTLAEWLAAMQAGSEKVRHGWTFAHAGIGGFPAHAARNARAKGMAVTLGVALPRKRPRLLQEFLDRHNLRIDPAHAHDGQMPHKLTFVFHDGIHRLLVDGGPETPPAALVPPRDFDVILISPGAPARRRPLNSFLRRLAAERPHATIGIVARDDWAAQDWHLLQGSRCHVF